MPNHAYFLTKLKNTIPESAWSWVLAALRQDSLIWQSLSDPEFCDKAFLEYGQEIEKWSPAGLCFLSLELPLPEEEIHLDPELRLQAIQTLDNLIHPDSAQTTIKRPDLAQAGLTALALLEIQRKSNSWINLADDLEASMSTPQDPVIKWGTALGVLYGLADDQLALLRALIRPGATELNIRLALHALLSNPRKPVDQEQILVAFFHELPISDSTCLIRILEQFRPKLANRLANRLLNLSNGQNLKTKNTIIKTSINNLADLLTEAEIHKIAGQLDKAHLLRKEALSLTREMQADLARSLVQTEFLEAQFPNIQNLWKESVSGPYHAAPPASLLVKLLEAGAFEEAEGIISQTDLVEDHPFRCLVTAHTAKHLGDHPSACQVARRCLGVLSNQINLPSQSQIDESECVPFLDAISLLIHLRDFLLDLSLYTEASSAALLLDGLQPHNANLLASQSTTYRIVGEPDKAVACAQLAVALEPEEVAYRRELATSLEAAGNWPAAFDERQKLMEARFAPLSEAYWPSAADWHALANCALHAGNSENAVQACQSALNINPEDGIAQAYMGEALLVQGKGELALEHFLLATQQTPHQPEPWLSLARAYKSSRQTGKAVETLRAASHAVPDHPQILFALAESYLEENAPTQAQAVLAHAFQLVAASNESFLRIGTKSFGQANQDNRQQSWNRDLLCQIGKAYGQILLRLGHTDQANQVFEKAYQIYPSYPGLAYAYGKTLLAKGELQAALTPLIIAIGGKPVDPQPYIDYAQTLLAVHDSPEEAIQALQQALQVIVVIENQLTTLLVSEGESSTDSFSPVESSQEQSETPTKTTWDSTPDSEWSPNKLQLTRLSSQALLAEAFEANSDLNSALKTFSEALESGLASSSDWHVRLSLGMARVALQLNQPEIAIAALQEDSHTDSNNPLIHRILAEAYASIHLPEEALQAAQATIRISPDDIETLSWFANLCTQINARSEAIPALNRAMQLDPNDAGLALRLGQLLLQISEPEAAHQAFLKVIANPNASAEHLSEAADSLITLGDETDAILALEKASCTQSTSDTQLLLRLASLYNQTTNVNRALDTIVKAIEVDPSDASLHYYKASLLVILGRPQAAQASLERALNLQPSNPAFHLHLAVLLRTEGDLNAALQHADTAVAVTQDTSDRKISQLARGVAAEINRILLQSDLALGSLSGKAQATLEIFPCDEDWMQSIETKSFHSSDQALFYCLTAELALDQDEEIAAAEALTQAIEQAPDALRVQALQSRLAFRRGDQHVALQTLQHALSELENQQTDKYCLLSAMANDLLALGIAAIDLEQWDIALDLLERASTRARFEPLPALYLARAYILRAEYQRLCQMLDCQSHSPGGLALDQGSSQAFQSALNAAFTRLPDELRVVPPNLYQRWEARGNAAFKPSSENLQALEEIRVSPDDDAAWLGQIALGGDLVVVNRAYSAIRDKYQGTISHPAILIQVALSKGFRGRRQEDLSESIAAVQSAIDQRPHQPLYHAMLSRIASSSGNLALAQHAILTALSFWPDEPRWHAQAAGFYLESGDVPAAITHLEKATTYEPCHLPHYLALGKAHLQTSQPAQAIAALEQAVKVAPEHVEGHLALASAYLSVGDLQKAAASAQAATDSAPDQLSPLILRADIALQMDDPSQTRSCAEQALRLQPDNAEALHLYAQALHKLGQTKQALQVVEKAIPLASDPLPFLLEQTSILESLQGYPATLNALQELANQYPDEPSVLAPLAKALAESNEIEEAIRTAQRALRGGSHSLRPRERAKLHHLLGQLLHQSGQLDQAIHQFSEATQLSPDQIDFYLDLGKTQLERRQNILAIQSYQKAIQVAPEDPRPFYQAGLVYKASRDYPEAEIMLRRAAELAPDDITIHRQLAALVALNLVHSRRPVQMDA